jgi:hypothetical protein
MSNARAVPIMFMSDYFLSLSFHAQEFSENALQADTVFRRYAQRGSDDNQQGCRAPLLFSNGLAPILFIRISCK